MDDQELILRYFGFYLHIESKIIYSGNMKYFLDSVNEYLNESTENITDDLLDKFLYAMKVCRHLFGKYAFRKCTPNDLEAGSRRPSINKAMFVVWAVLSNKINYDQLVENYDEGFLASKLAEEMIVRNSESDSYDFSSYYNYFTKGTFDLKTITNSFKSTDDLLIKYNLI
jgi:hypothetical protein